MSHKMEINKALVDDPTGDETGKPSLRGDVEKWCSDNLTAPYCFSVDSYFVFYHIEFSNCHDALHFKLRWI